MKFNFLKTIALSLAVLIGSASTATAGIYLNNDIEVGALNLTESFVNFYDYQGNGAKTYSSNTGYEQKNAIVMFLAEFNNELALVTLVDNYGAGSKGTASINIDNLSDFGSIIFKDDVGDVQTANGVDWVWAAKKNDGMVFQFADATSFDLDITFSNLTGLNKGIKFLSFSDNGVTEYAVDENLSIEVPEPTTLAIFALGILGLTARRLKK